MAFLIASIFCVSYRSGVRNDVTDVGHAREVHDNTLKAETVACVLGAAVTAKVYVPPVILFAKTTLFHTRQKHVKALLTLASADDLADAGHQKVHCGNRLAVVVEAHIERLDLLGIVDHEDGLLVDHLGEVSLVLGLQIAAPGNGILELVTALDKKVNSLGIGYLFVIALCQHIQTLKKGLVHKAIEEVQLLGAGVQHVTDDVLDHIPRQLHIIGKIGKGDLRLDHPELGRVSCGVGVLSAEGGAKGINVTEGHSVGLALQLTGNGKVGALSEEILGKVNLAVLSTRRIVHIQRGYAEHLARALTVGSGDQRGVYVHEASLMEKLVNRKSNLAAHAEDRGEQIGSGTKVCDLAQEFYAVSLLLQRIVGGGCALNVDGSRLDLKGLLVVGGQHKGTLDYDSRANVQLCDLGKVLNELTLKNDLYALMTATVIKVDEAAILAGSYTSYPTAEGHLAVSKGLHIRMKPFDQISFHMTPFGAARRLVANYISVYHFFGRL